MTRDGNSTAANLRTSRPIATVGQLPGTVRISRTKNVAVHVLSVSGRGNWSRRSSFSHLTNSVHKIGPDKPTRERKFLIAM